MVEPAAHNGLVGGSSPSGPTVVPTVAEWAAAPRLGDCGADGEPCVQRRRPASRHLIASALGLIVAALAVFALGRLSREITFAAVVAAISATPPATLGLAAALTVVSYLILTGYDWLALDHLGYRLPLVTVATAAFTSFTMSHTLGMTALTGGTVRYRLYTRVGVAPRDIVMIIALCGWTFWLGLVFAAGIGLTLDPSVAAMVDVLPPTLSRWAGPLLLGSAVGYMIIAACFRREFGVFGLRVRLPGWQSTAAQLVVGGLDLTAAAGALYVLLPAASLPSFSGIVVVYAVAMIAGALSHSPGGLGVFEIVVVAMLRHMPREGVIAALFMFRMLYTLIPFVAGLAVLARTELVALSRRRAAMRAPGAP